MAAGVGKMWYRAFIAYNAVGALFWGVGVTVLGYCLGQITFVQEKTELILIGIVALSVVPIVVELVRAKSASRDARYDEDAERERVVEERLPHD